MITLPQMLAVNVSGWPHSAATAPAALVAIDPAEDQALVIYDDGSLHWVALTAVEVIDHTALGLIDRYQGS